MLQETLVETINGDQNVKEEDENDDEDAEISDDPSKPQTYSSPAPKQRKTGRQRDSASAVMTSALNMLEPVASSHSSEPPPETDEMTAFFNYVSQKTKNYPPVTKIGVQHAIFEILIQADRGFYEEN